MVNGYTTIPTKLPDVGLPQGSPLSPILYILYNADLVDKKIDYRGGAIAFVDDYSAWVTGSDVETNTAVIQAQLIPRAEEWAKESGATFQAEKTSFIHFTRSAVKSKQTTVRVGMETITSSNSIKLLGVVLDAKLLFHEHVAKVAQRGHRAALALRRLRDMRPMTARQIFEATVTPMVDYASNVWATNLSAKDIRLLSQSQRVGAQAIIKAFSTTALKTAELEASVATLRARLAAKRQRFWINSHTLDRKHPFWDSKQLIRRVSRTFSPLWRIANEAKIVDISNLETIRPFCKPPWRGGA